jgi:hypothetical protein
MQVEIKLLIFNAKTTYNTHSKLDITAPLHLEEDAEPRLYLRPTHGALADTTGTAVA